MTLANLSRPKRIGATVKPMRSSVKAWKAASVRRRVDAVLTGAVDAPTVVTDMDLLLGTGHAELAYGWRAVLPAVVAHGVGGYQRHEALVVLVAGRAALQVSAHARHRRVRVGAGQRELDVAVDLVEARLAGQLGLRRAEDA